uniref:Uncharacterized protein n=1 Tax=Raphanus sativus TaxID=3726 RepID=A0A650GB34_RAPSA|nr:hypothetical protein [Raphanus sativus]QGW48497.1 hypothetical protein [Raphanus sativus]
MQKLAIQFSFVRAHQKSKTFSLYSEDLMKPYFSSTEHIRNPKLSLYIDGKVRKKEKREEFETKLREVATIARRPLLAPSKC